MADLDVTVRDIVVAAPLFVEGTADTLRFSAVTPTGAWRLKVLRPELDKALRAYDAERLERCRTHCVKTEAGDPLLEANQFQFTDEGRQAFERELEEILAQPVTLAGVRPLTLADLGDCRMSEQQMRRLGPFVVEA